MSVTYFCSNMRQETKKLLQALAFNFEMLIFSKQERPHLAQTVAGIHINRW